MIALLLVAGAALCWPAGRAGSRLDELGLRSGAGGALPGALRAPAGRRVGSGRWWRRAGPRSAPTADSTRAVRWRSWGLAGAAGIAVAVVLGGFVGAVAGAVTAVTAGWILARGAGDGDRAVLARRYADLPGALDLIGVCLRAGHPVGTALAQVADTIGGPLGADLGVAAAMHGLGADPRSAWADWSTDPVLAPVARVMSRTGGSGAAVTRALALLAEDCRAAQAERAEVATRRVGVLVLAPLGLCFLPAFVCLAVVPTVLGIAAEVLP